MTQFDEFLLRIKKYPDFFENVAFWQTQIAQQAQPFPFPSWLHNRLVDTFNSMGINSLYSHQFEAINCVKGGMNTVISTGTASGKSICYQIPIIDQLIKDQKSSAILLFPTKALTYDQLKSFSTILSTGKIFENQKSIAAVYDGDTPSQQRNAIRNNSKIILTNPDMLNVAILPHHTIWSEFFQNLKYIVIDEIHLYRGVFGSNIANLIRRLKRVAVFYGSSPRFIMTSATIANPKELASNLIEEETISIEADGSPKGEKNFVIYNPPVIDKDLGIRESLLTSTSKISELFLISNIQTLIFCRTRRFVELLVREIQALNPRSTKQIRGYRSGYLKKDRREIEEGLKNGSISLAIATNALELGIDIGGVDAVLLAGYPGSIASLHQRAGRSGRSLNSSVAILIASMNPLDQFFARNPKYLMERPLEQALIDANNPLILLSHIKSAAFELPFEESANFGLLNWTHLEEYLEYLCEEGVLQKKKTRYYWLSEHYPSGDFSLRSTISVRILLKYEDDGVIETIGDVDYNSALWMTHPGAIYLQDGLAFYVKTLDLEKGIAILTKSQADYLTEPIISVDIDAISQLKVKTFQNFILQYGEIEVTSKVTGFKKIQIITREILSAENLELPENRLQTTGFWIELTEKCVGLMRSKSIWLSDPNDYGRKWKSIRDSVRNRDNFTCQSCGRGEADVSFHVHHKIPFKMLFSIEEANEFGNLVTLCPDCHRRVELNFKIRSGLSGLKYLLTNLAPLLVLCDSTDLGSYVDPNAKFSNLKPVVLIYDSIPAGIGLSSSLYERFYELLKKCRELLNQCDCKVGCPSCVGPTSEVGIGGKKETSFLLSLLLEQDIK